MKRANLAFDQVHIAKKIPIFVRAPRKETARPQS
jgi:hypothetical protein